MISKQFGRQIKQRRTALGLAQEALCEKAEVSRTVLSRLENERGIPVQSDVLDRLTASLNTRVIVSLSDVQVERANVRLQHRLRLAELRERHLRLALDLCAQPGGARSRVERAMRQVDLWEQTQSCSPRYIEEWRKTLSMPSAQDVAVAMTAFGDWEDAMFQNSPWSFLWT